jgi:hypothetical protein
MTQVSGRIGKADKIERCPISREFGARHEELNLLLATTSSLKDARVVVRDD